MKTNTKQLSLAFEAKLKGLQNSSVQDALGLLPSISECAGYGLGLASTGGTLRRFNNLDDVARLFAG